MVRNPERIINITWKLSDLWSLVPDERFGQMLENYVYPAMKNVNGQSISVVDWHLEDDKLEKRLDKKIAFLRKLREKQGIGKTARKI